MKQPVGAGGGRFNLHAGFSTSHTGGVVLMPYLRAYILACPKVKCTQQSFEVCILRAQGSLEANECQDSITRPEIPVRLRISGRVGNGTGARNTSVQEAGSKAQEDPQVLSNFS